jgi:hypothetical protein
MSAHLKAPAVRSRIARALAVVLSERSHREVAEAVGIDPSTVSRRGADLAAWPSTDLLELACTDHDLAEALTIALTAAPVTALDRAPARAADLVIASERCGRFIAEALADAHDGRVSPLEARRMLDQSRALIDQLRDLNLALAVTAEAGR